MPKKTKKGGGDGGRTEGERMLLLQQRAQAEEETAKKKEEILTLFLRDKLQKEERNTVVNLLKLKDSWRRSLLQTRAAELSREVGVLAQTFGRRLDRLDSLFKSLERELQEAERQAAQVWRTHLQQLERLGAQKDKLQTDVQQQWARALQQHRCRFNSDWEEELEHSNEQRTDLEDAVFTVEQQHKDMMDEIHRLYKDGMQALSISNHQKKTETIITTKEVQEEAEQLNRREELLRKKVLLRTQQTEAEKVKVLQELLLKQFEELTALKSQEEKLTADRDQVNYSLLSLRDQLTQAQATTKKQLANLTVQSDEETKRQQALIAKGETLLQAAEMSCKLEDELLQELLTEENREGAAQPMHELHQVTRSINTAVLQREALRRRDHDLSQENQQLELLLQLYLDATSVSHQHLDPDNNLLHVYRAPTSTAAPNTSRRHNVIEAVHAVQHSL